MSVPSVTNCGRVRILGIDPGTRVLGYGVVEAPVETHATQTPGVARAEPRHIESGALRLAGSLASRLEKIFLDLRALVVRLEPQVVAIEDVFYGRSFESALKLGQARGVVLLTAQLSKLEIHEFAPTQVKKGVTGNGKASKEQVERMVWRILKLRERPSSTDVSDALAVAFCCGEALGRAARLGRSGIALPSSAHGTRRRRRTAASVEALVESGKASWVSPAPGGASRKRKGPAQR